MMTVARGEVVTEDLAILQYDAKGRAIEYWPLWSQLQGVARRATECQLRDQMQNRPGLCDRPPGIIDLRKH